jgi:RHS repeat-associated protein
VILHEWVERFEDVNNEYEIPDSLQSDEINTASLQAQLDGRPSNGPPESSELPLPATWLFDPDSFAPASKIVGDKHYSIITDHLGTPLSMFDETGVQTWGAELDIYGSVKSLHGDRSDCPFRYPGQYEDSETGLYYNRFRYYDSEISEYISQDPLGIICGLNFYAYTHDPTCWTDAFGLSPIWSNTAMRWRESTTGRFITRPTNLMSTKPNQAFFWSGRTDGIGGMDEAAKIAKANIGTTLEMLIEKHKIVMPNWDANNPVHVKEWGKMSEAYAQGASGKVRGVIGTDLRPDNIWEGYEKGALKANPKVTSIETIDPKTGAKTKIYKKGCS